VTLETLDSWQSWLVFLLPFATLLLAVLLGTHTHMRFTTLSSDKDCASSVLQCEALQSGEMVGRRFALRNFPAMSQSLALQAVFPGN
jgi:hypothetical protein